MHTYTYCVRLHRKVPYPHQVCSCSVTNNISRIIIAVLTTYLCARLHLPVSITSFSQRSNQKLQHICARTPSCHSVFCNSITVMNFHIFPRYVTTTISEPWSGAGGSPACQFRIIDMLLIVVKKNNGCGVGLLCNVITTVPDLLKIGHHLTVV